MGCICRTSRSKFDGTNFISVKTMSKKSHNPNDYINNISKKDWINILDYLNYNEIKETAKVNK